MKAITAADAKKLVHNNVLVSFLCQINVDWEGHVWLNKYEAKDMIITLGYVSEPVHLWEHLQENENWNDVLRFNIVHEGKVWMDILLDVSSDGFEVKDVALHYPNQKDEDPVEDLVSAMIDGLGAYCATGNDSY